jgi:hypothetical protein
MNTTRIVPAGFVQYLRSGLFGEWGDAAKELSNLAVEFGSGAPDGAYWEPMHKFLTIYILLGEIGRKDTATQGDVVVNLSIGGEYIVSGLKHEHLVLVDRLNEMPKRTRKAMRDAASAKVAEFGEFVADVETQTNRLSLGRDTSSEPVTKTSRSPLSPRPTRVRRPH